jgi:hypothetical protein
VAAGWRPHLDARRLLTGASDTVAVLPSKVVPLANRHSGREPTHADAGAALRGAGGRRRAAGPCPRRDGLQRVRVHEGGGQDRQRRGVSCGGQEDDRVLLRRARVDPLHDGLPLRDDALRSGGGADNAIDGMGEFGHVFSDLLGTDTGQAVG